MLPKFPFPGTGKDGPGIMDSLKAIGEVADLLTNIRDELRSLNVNLIRYNDAQLSHAMPIPEQYRKVESDRPQTSNANSST